MSIFKYFLIPHRVLEVCWDLVVLQDLLDRLYVPSALLSLPLISLPVIDMRYI